MKDTNAELLCTILNEAWPGQFVTQHLGIQERNYAFDVANIGKKVAIEVEGGLHPFYITNKRGKKILITRGGHSSNDGIERDMRKGNAAQVEGWKYLRYSTHTLKKNPYEIITDLWKLIGEPTGTRSMAMLEASLKAEEKKQTRRKIAKIEGQQVIA